MTRLRRVDRTILAESADPLDEDDQAALIADFSLLNNASLRIASRVLVASVVVELPVMLYVTRLVSRDLGLTVLVVLCNLLTLVNGLYEVPAGFRHPRLPAVFSAVLSSNGIFAVNMVMWLQMMYSASARHGFLARLLCLVLPGVNAVAIALMRMWHRNMEAQIGQLDQLRYKFKTA